MVEKKRAGFGVYLGGILMVVAAGLAVFYFTRNHAIQLASARNTIEAEAALGPRVEVVLVKEGPKTRDIRLLGDAKAFNATTMFAKVSGYIKAIHVDKGDPVRAGQVLVEIDSPELESQYSSAVADLEYKQRVAARSRELLTRGSVAVQATDQAETSLRMAQETVRNLSVMKSYQVLRAPFDGTITARFADPGALMQAATTNQTSSLPVLVISDNSRLRIGAYVEQRDVAEVQIGSPAVVVDASNPERKITAKISRTSATLDPRTRTLFVEIDIDNREGFLVPGSFAYVTLTVPVKSFPQVPVSAVVQRGGVQMLALTSEQGEVRLRQITTASTDGVVINVAEGVAPGERVAINVPNEVTDGSRVRPVLRR